MRLAVRKSDKLDGGGSTMDPHERAQEGLEQLKEAVIDLLTHHPEGLRNFEIASALGIRSDQEGRQENFLSYSILGLLMRAGAVTKTDERRYKLTRRNS